MKATALISTLQHLYRRLPRRGSFLGRSAAALGLIACAHIASADQSLTVDSTEGAVHMVELSSDVRSSAKVGATLAPSHAMETGADGRAALSLGGGGGEEDQRQFVVVLGPNSHLRLLASEGDEKVVVHLVHGSLRFVQPLGRTGEAGLLIGSGKLADGSVAPPLMVRGSDLFASYIQADHAGTVAVQRGEIEARIGARRIVFRPMMMRDMRMTGPAGARGISPADWAVLVEPLSMPGVSLPGVAAAVGSAAATGAAGPAGAESGTDGPDLQYFRMETTLGNFVLELDATRAPISTENFAHYVDSGFYVGTLFHRVVRRGIKVIQGGGFTRGMQPKQPDRSGIRNEWRNGLTNDRGTISMARTPAPDSGTTQFFINTGGNPSLDRPDAQGAAYAVFGRVVSGMDVVDAIQAVPTMTRGRHGDVPAEDVVITRVVRLSDEEIGQLDITPPQD